MKQLDKLDKRANAQIANYLFERLEKMENPRSAGKRLKGKLGAYWRYRTGDYRLFCEIKDDELVILVVEVGNRKGIYE